jgi:hypothetical protein
VCVCSLHLARRGGLRGLAGEGVRGSLGEHACQDDTGGDKPAIDSVKLAQRRVARVGRVNRHRELAVQAQVVKYARTV